MLSKHARGIEGRWPSSASRRVRSRSSVPYLMGLLSLQSWFSHGGRCRRSRCGATAVSTALPSGPGGGSELGACVARSVRGFVLHVTESPGRNARGRDQTSGRRNEPSCVSMASANGGSCWRRRAGRGTRAGPIRIFMSPGGWPAKSMTAARSDSRPSKIVLLPRWRLIIRAVCSCSRARAPLSHFCPRPQAASTGCLRGWRQINGASLQRTGARPSRRFRRADDRRQRQRHRRRPIR